MEFWLSRLSMKLLLLCQIQRFIGSLMIGPELRAERDVVCLISNCPQLNNPCNAYNPTPVEVLIWD
jgi:hypothetical protein